MGIFAPLMTDRARRLAQDHLAGVVPAPATVPSDWFAARVDANAPPASPTDGPGAAGEDASRSGTHYALFWEAAPDIVAGDRLEVAPRGEASTTVYEVAAVPEAHRGLAGTLAVSAEAVRLSDLYPLTGQLEELGGTVVDAALPIGMWRASDAIDQEAGVQYDYDAVVPYDRRAELDPSDHPNRQVRVGGRAYRIVGTSPRERVPRVVLRLRAVRSGG